MIKRAYSIGHFGIWQMPTAADTIYWEWREIICIEVFLSYRAVSVIHFCNYHHEGFCAFLDRGKQKQIVRQKWQGQRNIIHASQENFEVQPLPFSDVGSWNFYFCLDFASCCAN